MALPEAAILATMNRQYAETRARLASDTEYQAMKARAEAEALETPGYYLARNMLSLHEEINMPSILVTGERARAEYAATHPTRWERFMRALGLRSIHTRREGER